MPQRQVVDTSAWIEWMSDTALGQSLVQDFPEPDHRIAAMQILRTCRQSGFIRKIRGPVAQVLAPHLKANGIAGQRLLNLS
ncbi:hypothetical protein [Mitsuaria sp. 7]|uniref:hypothetical protein n=1 Tax=Mitsuaria sp. 7 TaxID=1658665 RepID=UPI0012F9B839|nr:hypothetical protein [Mitsuaria sp. 7]